MIQGFFLQLVCILVLARIFGECAAKCKIPSVLGELFAGVLLGPSLFGIMEPTHTIQLLSQVGVVLLLFQVGMETDVVRLKKTGYKPFLVATVGFILPFVLGLLICYQTFSLDIPTSLFIASALTATSIGITVRVLSDLKKQNSDEAQIVLGAAVFDDILGIILLALLFDFSVTGEISLVRLSKTFFFICLFLTLAPFIAKYFAGFIEKYERRSEIPGIIPTLVISTLLLFAWCAHLLSAPELLGGFAAGLAFSTHFSLPFSSSITEAFSEKVATQMRPIINLFTPIFFVNIGLSLNLRILEWNSLFIWELSLSLLAVAIIGKLASGFFLFQDKKWIKWVVGLAMIPRGEVGLIFAEVGRDLEVLTNEFYAALIIVIAGTTLFAPLLLQAFYRRKV